MRISMSLPKKLLNDKRRELLLAAKRISRTFRKKLFSRRKGLNLPRFHKVQKTPFIKLPQKQKLFQKRLQKKKPHLLQIILVLINRLQSEKQKLLAKTKPQKELVKKLNLNSLLVQKKFVRVVTLCR